MKKIIEWGHKYLLAHGYSVKNELTAIVKETPWSYVVRFVTSAGNIYLKQTPELLALEANIIKILQEQFQAPVPEIITHNLELNCFLMKDAGKPLREILKKQFDMSLLCQAIAKFITLQTAVAKNVDVLIESFVPDWRLDKIPDLFMQLLAEKDLLLEDGLSEIEIDKLKKLAINVADLCKKLADFSIKQTLVQPDFHDNNILIKDKITLIDLGEIVISHPYFSLINCLDQIKKHHGISDKDYSYLKNYMQLEPNALAIAQKLLPLYGALALYRLMQACDKEKFKSFQMQWRLRESLQNLMTNML